MRRSLSSPDRRALLARLRKRFAHPRLADLEAMVSRELPDLVDDTIEVVLRAGRIVERGEGAILSALEPAMASAGVTAEEVGAESGGGR
jgi:hypothetical protein